MRKYQALLVAALSLTCAAEPGYRKPSAAIDRVLRAPLPPSTWLSPTREWMLEATPVNRPPLADLAQPMLRLGGIRLIPNNRAHHGERYWSDLQLVHVSDGKVTPCHLPRGARIGALLWSADSQQFAFPVQTPNAIELWVGRTDGKIRKIPQVRLNPMFGDALSWMPDQKRIFVLTVPNNQGPAPSNSGPPPAPNVQECSGGKAASTYEVRDVLKGPRDEALFDYYAQTQLAIIDSASGQITPLGKPGLYSQAEPSPDGHHFLVRTVHRPYSSVTTWGNFAREIDLWDEKGRREAHLASLPKAESIPTWGVAEGPRDFEWRPTAPATLVWAEALDGGDWKTQVPHRDKILSWQAPFADKPREILRSGLRFDGFRWFASGGQALYSDYDAIKHWNRTFLVNFDAPDPKLLWELSSDERYNDPGSPLFRRTGNGQWVLDQDGDWIYLVGNGSSPAGDRPFLDKFNTKTMAKERLFRCSSEGYQNFVAWVDRSKGLFLVRHESPSQPPNLQLRALGEKQPEAPSGEAQFASQPVREVTHFPDPTPEVRGITKRLVKYKRADGLDLSFTLYLPPGYKEGTRLPAVLWAYPLDYADAKVAGQVSGSTQRFTYLALHQLCLLDGYALIDSPALPVVGDANRIYDTYMEQLISGAQAAVDKAVEMGVVDRDRIGVTGHSHGGLMTVNLLTHTNLFRAGVARSGAYNRSLTAFGFQNERRTLWEAPDVYLKVSPFFHIDKLKNPVLLIHGEADANPGTVPLQSQALYEAIRGNGGTAKLVMLPLESHGYAALESNEHVAYEMLEWFNRYVKNAAPRS